VEVCGGAAILSGYRVTCTIPDGLRGRCVPLKVFQMQLMARLGQAPGPAPGSLQEGTRERWGKRVPAAPWGRMLEVREHRRGDEGGLRRLWDSCQLRAPAEVTRLVAG